MSGNKYNEVKKKGAYIHVGLHATIISQIEHGSQKFKQIQTQMKKNQSYIMNVSNQDITDVIFNVNRFKTGTMKYDSIWKHKREPQDHQQTLACFYTKCHMFAKEKNYLSSWKNEKTCMWSKNWSNSQSILHNKSLTTKV